MKILAAAASIMGLVLTTLTANAQPFPSGPTLAKVRERGVLNCGVPPSVPGFGSQQSDKTWQGFEVDLCRAIAAAVLGNAQQVSLSLIHI